MRKIIKDKDKKIIIRKWYENKGITLIALVVTIIVLLILAGISIQMLVGEGGILTNAKDASRETNKATAKENIDLEIAETVLEYNDLTTEGLNKHFKAHLPNLTHEGQNLTENPIEEFPTIVELDGFVFEIDEYGKTKEVNGIILSKSSLNLQIEISGTEKTCEETELTATLAGISGDITWNTEGEAVEVTKLEGGKSVNVKAQKAGEATITATCSGKTAECSVTVVEEEYIDNSYVNYDVTYKDVYTGTQYTSKTGWRLLTKIEEEKDKYNETKGTYTGDIEIISTGIPAKLYYSNVIKNFEIEDELSNVTKGYWAGNAEQRVKFANDYFGENSNKENNENVYAAAGLLNNFKNIVFKVTGTKDTLETGSGNAFESRDTRNYGGYIEIKKNGKEVKASENTTGEDLFEAKIANGSIKEIRSVHLGDIKGSNTKDTDKEQITSSSDKRQGLFILDNYTPEHNTSYKYFRLASPYTYTNDSIWGVMNNGRITYGSGCAGVRPVISISNVRMKLNGHVWEIIE